MGSYTARFARGAWVNHLDADEGQARVPDAYGPVIYERLVDVKTAWDSENVFRLNHNIQPRRSATVGTSATMPTSRVP